MCIQKHLYSQNNSEEFHLEKLIQKLIFRVAMASKNRSKDKKLLRKKSNEYLCALEQFCRRAQDVDDMMENLKLFSKYEKNNLSLRLIYKKSELLTETEQNDIFGLLEDNMRHLYEQSAVGWIKREKWRELFDPDARFILAFDPNDSMCG